jgi:hypothetical protein
MPTLNLGKVKGETGPQGPKGDPGRSFNVDATGPLSQKSNYDNEAEGFSFLAIDVSLLYIRNGVAGSWLDPIEFGKGEQGDAGPQGLKGDAGNAATISLGTVSTGAAGSSATITNSGTASAAVLDFTIPRGDKGTTGNIGPSGPEPSLNVADNAATSITLADTDNNKIMRCTSSSAVTITVPSTLASGFSCMVIQAGTGQVTLVAGSGATLNSFGALLKTAGQHAPASLISVGAGVYNLSGNLV